MSRIGLVLSAGGSVGVAYHGGVLSTIEEVTGWDPRTAEAVVGTSAGSITTALLRLGLPAADLASVSEGRPLSPEGVALAAGVPHRPRTSFGSMLRPRPMADPGAVARGLLRPWARSPASLLAALLPAGWMPTDALSSGLDASYEKRWPDRTFLCAVRLRDGKRVVFGSPGAPPATVGRAVAASCAIPGYYRPVRIGADRYVDGGVSSMANLDALTDPRNWVEPPLDLIVVSAPLSQSSPWPGLAPDFVLRQASRVQLRNEVTRARRTGVPVVVVAPGPSVVEAMGLNPMDARRRGGVSRKAREATRHYLESHAEGRVLADTLRAVVTASAVDQRRNG